MNGSYFGYPTYPNPASFAQGVRSSVPNIGIGAVRSAPSLLAGAGNAPGILSRIGGLTKGFTFTGFLNGASKTLGVINQAIPVFYQAKPIWNNAKTMFRVMKEVGNSSSVSKNTLKEEESVKESKLLTKESNGPTFYA